MQINVPTGMTRRHFLNHALSSAAAVPALEFLMHLEANAAPVRKNQKACILIWLGGGPPTIDMWDMKPGSKNGGEFKPIDTPGGLQISEHLAEGRPRSASKMSIVRSMSTREADHGRGRYYLHTAYVPNPTVDAPVVRLGRQPRAGLEAASGSKSPRSSPSAARARARASSAMANAPFVVDGSGQIRNAQCDNDGRRSGSTIGSRCSTSSKRASSIRSAAKPPQAHKDIYKKAVNLMTSKQMAAFSCRSERPEVWPPTATTTSAAAW